MKRLLRRFVYTLAMAALLAPAGGRAQMADELPAEMQAAETLVSHGIATDPASLMAFLREGFDVAALPRGLPASPSLKVEVVDSAIRELAVQRSEAAVPLLIELAESRPPAAVDRIIRRDLEGLPLEYGDRAMAESVELLATNATVALGLIGDERAIPALLARLRSPLPAAPKADAAVALGMMGRGEGLEEMLALARRVESNDCVLAFATVYILTGRNYGVSINTSLARRRALVDELERWYHGGGKETPIYRSEVRRRQSAPPQATVLEPNSLRGMLRDTFNVFDYDRRFLARQHLRDQMNSRFDELSAIVADPMEELDVRRAAMQWIVVANPNGSKSVLRRQRRDENPMIRDAADAMLEEIPRLIEERRNARR